jgi:iron complex transport system permease protein
LAFLAGTALATSGMAFQAIFRNPLATPYTLGVSSGAALGAVVCTLLHGGFNLLGFPCASWSAILGAMLSIAMLYGTTARSRQGGMATMLSAGLAVSFFFLSLILLLIYIVSPTNSFLMLRWVLGGMDRAVDFHDFWNVLPFAVSGFLIVWYLTHELNLLVSGEEFAFSRGLSLGKTKLLLFFAVSLMVGGVASVCGPIGFVGLIAPCLCRLLVGSDHRCLFPMTWLFGGTFLVVCDTAARMAMSPTELPVGILTALLGCPFFLRLLLKPKRSFGDI